MHLKLIQRCERQQARLLIKCTAKRSKWKLPPALLLHRSMLVQRPLRGAAGAAASSMAAWLHGSGEPC